MKLLKTVLFLCLVFMGLGKVWADDAVVWTDTKNTSGQRIYIDLASIDYYEHNLFYNVKVYVPAKDEDMVYTVHVKTSDMLYGIAQKYTYKEYIEQCKNSGCSAIQNAQYFKELKKTSPGYNAVVWASKYASVRPYWRNYIKDMQLSLLNNWHPTIDANSKSVVISFKLDRSGKLLESAVFKSSKDKVYDNLALETVKKSVPFMPFPVEEKQNEKVFQFTFNYNVILGDGSSNYDAAQEKQDFGNGLMWLSTFGMLLLAL